MDPFIRKTPSGKSFTELAMKARLRMGKNRLPVSATDYKRHDQARFADGQAFLGFHYYRTRKFNRIVEIQLHCGLTFMQALMKSLGRKSYDIAPDAN